MHPECPQFPEGMFYDILKAGDSHTYPDEDFKGSLEKNVKK